ncbi:hypothetical protein BSKO_06459 [Bryopsis sp. KO-2023]|nr:hypothetical protein BSKO_06459 [Bryopsis sp. KO-2023]
MLRLRATFVAVLLALCAGSTLGAIDDFVQTAGTRFVITREDECENFYFTGTNNYYLMLRAADELGRCEVEEILDKSVELGINVIRTWGFSEGPLEWRSLQPAPGEYDENTWRGMDFALDEASKRGVRLLIAFGNYWQHFGGTDQYNRWAWQAGNGTCNGEFACRDEFFTNPYTRQMYKNHIQTTLMRKNSINGRVYRDDPTIFGWNLMNEPRSYVDLYTVTRETTSGLVYNISYNSGDGLQDWIEDMAGFVKSVDPVHLLTVGEEGFFGASTPLYLYANPGPWATLEGVDFVRNHKAKGIDFATMHAYVDQWLCTVEGKDREGQMSFFKDWIEVHQQAAEEDLQMPVVLEEFGGKLGDRKRYDIFKEAFDSQYVSQQRGGSFGGVLFWILYHSRYFPLDHYGGGYGQYFPTQSDEYDEVDVMLREHSGRVTSLNSNQTGAEVCLFEPPVPTGVGCHSLDLSLHVGGMPWVCLPGEPDNVGFCSQKGANLYKEPPQEWKGTYSNFEAPFNTIEVVILGQIRNAGKKPVNLKGAWIIVPFSRGVHTKVEGEWTRMDDPNENFKVHCWAVSQYTTEVDWSKDGNLCWHGVDVSFTENSWPEGTKADRGLKIEFTKTIILQPGDTLHGHVTDGDIMISIADNKCETSERELCEQRLDVSSMQSWARGEDVTLNYYNVQAAMSCPKAPKPPVAPKRKPKCGHPWHACPLKKIPKRRSQPLHLFEKGKTYTRTQPVEIEGILSEAATQYYVSGEVWVSGTSEKFGAKLAKRAKKATGELWDAGDVLVDPTDAPNPGEERSDHIAKGVQASLVLQYTADGVQRRQVVGSTEAPDGEWTLIRGVVEIPAGSSEVEIFAEVPMHGAGINVQKLRARHPSLLTIKESEKYDPCQIDPELGSDAVYVFEPKESMTIDVRLCSRGYDQGLRIYKDGVEEARTDNECSRVDDVKDFEMEAGSKYTFVVDGYPGYPYGSFRGGRGIQIKRKDGAPFQGFDFAPTSKRRNEFVRAEGASFYKGCDPYYYVGANTWNLMDTARYPSLWWAVEERLDEMKSQGLTVGRTWAFSLGTRDTEEGRKQRLHLAPGKYDETVFQALDYALDAAGKRDMKLLLALEDYWLSIDRYLEWSEGAGSRNDFYTEWDIRQMYKDHIKMIVNRRNTFNGMLYREDPTILGWNLMNEPRCTGCGWAISAWVDEMSLYMKSIDPNHMVTIGEEGFYSSTCERVWLNPGAGIRRTGIGSSPWALQEGQDFLANHRSENIDFATVHAWPDNWIGFADYSPWLSNENFDYKYEGDVWKEKLDYLKLWISAHLEDAEKLGKPVIIEEFGKAIPAQKLYEEAGPRALRAGESTAGDLAIRDSFFKMVYDLVEKSANSGGPALGSNFWVLYRWGCGECYKDPYIVVKSHNTTMQLVRNHSWNMRNSTQGRPEMCLREEGLTWDDTTLKQEAKLFEKITLAKEVESSGGVAIQNGASDAGEKEERPPKSRRGRSQAKGAKKPKKARKFKKRPSRKVRKSDVKRLRKSRAAARREVGIEDGNTEKGMGFPPTEKESTETPVERREEVHSALGSSPVKQIDEEEVEKAAMTKPKNSGAEKSVGSSPDVEGGKAKQSGSEHNENEMKSQKKRPAKKKSRKKTGDSADAGTNGSGTSEENKDLLLKGEPQEGSPSDEKLGKTARQKQNMETNGSSEQSVEKSGGSSVTADETESVGGVSSNEREVEEEAGSGQNGSSNSKKGEKSSVEKNEKEKEQTPVTDKKFKDVEIFKNGGGADDGEKRRKDAKIGKL